MTTIGFIGAGNIGQSVARLAVDHGYDVVLSNSRGPETLTDVVADLGDARDADTAEGAAARGDLVVVTVPFKAYRRRAGRTARRQGRDRHEQLLPAARRPVRRLDDKADDVRLAAAGAPAGVAGREGVQPHPVRHLLEHAQAAGTAGRRALAIAGDDDEAKATVAQLIDEFGFDVVDVGPLAEPGASSPSTPGYGPRLDADGMREALAAASAEAPRLGRVLTAAT